MIWSEFEGAAPALAALGRERFERDRLALIGTLRANGSPRISPVEPYLALGHLLLGMEWPTSKARDLLRDPRCALHSVVSDPDGADGEFKLSGRAQLVEHEAIVNGPRGVVARPAARNLPRVLHGHPVSGFHRLEHRIRPDAPDPVVARPRG